MPRISARVEGISDAPASPIRSRAAISSAAESAMIATSEAAENSVTPMSSNRRRPMRSPIAPIASSAPATRNT
jgi:hypothetical protein